MYFRSSSGVAPIFNRCHTKFAPSFLLKMKVFGRTTLDSAKKMSSNASVGLNNLPIIPTLGMLVGTTALTFQLYVLYPWRHELS